MSSNKDDKVREALEKCVVELGFLVEQTSSRPGGSVHRAYEEALAALGEEPCGEAEELAREVEGSYGCAVLPFDSWAARLRSIAGLPAQEKP